MFCSRDQFINIRDLHARIWLDRRTSTLHHERQETAVAAHLILRVHLAAYSAGASLTNIPKLCALRVTQLSSHCLKSIRVGRGTAGEHSNCGNRRDSHGGGRCQFQTWFAIAFLIQSLGGPVLGLGSALSLCASIASR